MPSDTSTLIWVLGVEGALYFGLLVLLWNYIRESVKALYEYVTKQTDDLNQEIGTMAKQAREDAKDYENRYARKDSVDELKRDIGSLRGEVSTQFTGIHTQIGGVSAQLVNILTIVTKNDKA